MDRRKLPVLLLSGAAVCLAVACLIHVTTSEQVAPSGHAAEATSAAMPAPPPAEAMTRVPTPAVQGSQQPVTPVFLPVPRRYRGEVIRSRVRYFPERLLALTFDDGPSESVTPRILDALREHGAHATFFELGSSIEGSEELTRRVFSEGHAVGSHSYSHPSSTPPGKATSELRRTAELIEKCTGHKPQLFRPPYGIVKGNLNRTALAEGYTSILWTISSADTDSRATVETIANNVIHTPNPGDIVLMHDSASHADTAAALPRILEELGAAGFRFVTIPELLGAWHRWLAEDVGPQAHLQPATARP